MLLNKGPKIEVLKVVWSCQSAPLLIVVPTLPLMPPGKTEEALVQVVSPLTFSVRPPVRLWGLVPLRVRVPLSVVVPVPVMVPAQVVRPETVTVPAPARVPPLKPPLRVSALMADAFAMESEPPLIASVSLPGMLRLLIEWVPVLWVIVRTVAPPTSIVTSSAEPGRRGLLLQFAATSQKPSASTFHKTEAECTGIAIRLRTSDPNPKSPHLTFWLIVIHGFMKRPP